MKLPKKVRWTHHYGFRHGEWSTVIGTEMYKPSDNLERRVYKVKYDDGLIDYIPVSEKQYLEFQY